MRRLLLVLALTALFVASAFASGSALAQGKACEGLDTAVDTQTGGPLPSQGDENSALEPGVFQQLHCVPLPG